VLNSTGLLQKIGLTTEQAAYFFEASESPVHFGLTELGLNSDQIILVEQLISKNVTFKAIQNAGILRQGNLTNT
jgi:hypothetical protein